jgi:hypothetical protein
VRDVLTVALQRCLADIAETLSDDDDDVAAKVEALLEASEADGNWISVDLDGYRAVGEEGKKEA